MARKPLKINDLAPVPFRGTFFPFLDIFNVNVTVPFSCLSLKIRGFCPWHALCNSPFVNAKTRLLVRHNDERPVYATNE